MYQVGDKNKWKTESNFLDHVTFIHLDETTEKRMGYCLLGYKTSEGARRNDGREGAFHGPDAIREKLFEMHYHGEMLYDGGDLCSKDNDLEKLQEELYHYTKRILASGLKPIILGGDHSLSWPVYRALRDSRSERFSIINIDAHFDMRDDPLNSGTSFYYMKEDFDRRGEDFPYYALGIHPHQTSPELFKRAENAGVYYQSMLDFSLEALKGQLSHKKNYLSLCLDAITSVYAEGVSAPDPLGLHPKEVLRFIRELKEDTLAFSIAELAPSLEEGSQTAMVTAELLYYFLHK